MGENIRDLWQAAVSKASFYSSFQNTVEFWDKMASTSSAGISGKEKFEPLLAFFNDNNISLKDFTILDAGCGDGDYTLEFAPLCKKIIALDSSSAMLNLCQKKAEEKQISNIEFLNKDLLDANCKADMVLACLNPVTYTPEGFEKILDNCSKWLVFFSMDIPKVPEKAEPIYNGSNSVHFPYEYLKEKGFSPKLLPYTYIMKKPDGNEVKIPFAYVICNIE